MKEYDLDFEKLKFVSSMAKDLFLNMGGATVPAEYVSGCIRNAVALSLAFVNESMRQIETPISTEIKHEKH